MLRTKSIAAMLTLLLSAACQQTPRLQPAPPATASALCLIDRVIPVNVAPGPDWNDTDNRYDSDETYARIDAHNARLAAACLKD